MARINSKLLDEIIRRTGLSRSQIYARIAQVSADRYLPRHLAAIVVGSDTGVTIGKFASGEDLAELRRAGNPVTPPIDADLPTARGGNSMNPGTSSARRPKGTHRVGRGKPQAPNQVFVVHGRDRDARNAMFAFLRSLDITPIEWNSALAMTRKAMPYIDEIVEKAFAKARAIVILLTPDDQAQLRQDLLTKNDPPFERRLTGQARPNVIFEAGMAFSSHADRTVMVQLGMVRPFSDIAGKHVVHMDNSPERRQELATKLRNAGCDIDQNGTDWLSVGDFANPESRTPRSRANRKGIA